jgi:hypothetical protein
MNYPLYDVPYLVRDPNDTYMSQKRHQTEVRNQAAVDDYFVERANGATAQEAREVVAIKHGITTQRADRIIRWFYEEAKKRRKYVFCKNSHPLRNT